MGWVEERFWGRCFFVALTPPCFPPTQAWRKSSCTTTSWPRCARVAASVVWLCVDAQAPNKKDTHTPPFFPHTQIPPLAPLTSLTRLDVSYNSLRSLIPLASAPACPLADLSAASNKITRIEALSSFTDLCFLELGSNRIPAVEGLASQAPTLRELWLGRNRVTQMAGLAPLTRLVRVSLQSNRLASMADLPPLPCLEELYLSHNGITALEALGGLPRLRVLDVAANDVAEVDGLKALKDSGAPLTDLWLNDNVRLPPRGQLLAALAGTPAASTLTCVYLAATPAAAGDKGEYVGDLVAALPALECVDGDDLPPRGRRLGTA